MNKTVENIGARRLHTLMERILEEVPARRPQPQLALSCGPPFSALCPHVVQHRRIELNAIATAQISFLAGDKTEGDKTDGKAGTEYVVTAELVTPPAQ